MKTPLVLLALFCLVQGACSTNPTTGRSQFNAMSREEEIQLGTQAQPELTKEFGGAVKNAELQAYVSDIGHRLAAVTEADNPSLPWEFTLLDSDVINAFALPGGKVFFSRGLAERMSNEAQMAAVLGHEVGHVTARHSNDRMTQTTVLGVGGAIIGGILGGQTGMEAGQTVGGIAAMSYSRDQEIEADRLGMRYMERIKYNPYAAVEVQEILGEAAKESGGRQPEFLSTHPTSETRIAELRKRLDKYYRHTEDNPEYQFHEQRFREQFLRKLAAMDPPSHPGPRGSLLASLGDPVLWCAHCREDAAHGRGVLAEQP